MIVLYIHNDTRVAQQVELSAEAGYVMGRSDESSDFIPDIDLAEFGARDMGVSRRHAAIIRFRGQPHVLDLNSVNGTFLNGRRLTGETPYLLEDQSRIQLGTLQISIRLVEENT